MKRPKAADCPPGWAPVAGEAAAALEAELRRELGSRHALAGLQARALAQRFDDDDVLYGLDDGRVAEVHLTWRGGPEPDPAWPAARLFASFAEWSAAASGDAGPSDFTDELDLHAFAPQDAESLVRDFVDHWARHGPREVRIIHGKGVGALRRIVHGVLEGHPAVTKFALASDRSGWGATIASVARLSSGDEADGVA